MIQKKDLKTGDTILVKLTIVDIQHGLLKQDTNRGVTAQENDGVFHEVAIESIEKHIPKQVKLKTGKSYITKEGDKIDILGLTDEYVWYIFYYKNCKSFTNPLTKSISSIKDIVSFEWNPKDE